MLAQQAPTPADHLKILRPSTELPPPGFVAPWRAWDSTSRMGEGAGGVLRTREGERCKIMCKHESQTIHGTGIVHVL